jgi:hypothetical protein
VHHDLFHSTLSRAARALRPSVRSYVRTGTSKSPAMGGQPSPGRTAAAERCLCLPACPSANLSVRHQVAICTGRSLREQPALEPAVHLSNTVCCRSSRSASTCQLKPDTTGGIAPPPPKKNPKKVDCGRAESLCLLDRLRGAESMCLLDRLQEG